jgi:hypothetical protein
VCAVHLVNELSNRLKYIICLQGFCTKLRKMRNPMACIGTIAFLHRLKYERWKLASIEQL